MKEYILRVNFQETMSYFDFHKTPELIRCKYCNKKIERKFYEWQMN